MLVSIIIPAYNEEETIFKVIKKVSLIKLRTGIKKEIIVVDDASTDTTTLKLRSASKSIKIIVLKHKVNMGKGAAIVTGLKHAHGEIVVIQDADLEYDPKYIPQLIEPILKKQTDIVYGTRLKNYPLRLTGKKKTPLITHYLGNKFLSLITSLFYGVNVSDMETGYKVFRKNVTFGIKFRSKGFDFEPEFTSKILKRGYQIFEIPIHTSPRGYDEGKKITWKDGFLALKTLIKYRLFE